MEMKIYRSSGARWRWQSRCLRVNFIAKTPTWTRICPLAFPNPFYRSLDLAPLNGSFHLHLTSRPPLSSARNSVHKVFHSEIPPDRARLHFSASSLRPINSTSSFDFVPHIWHGLLKFSRTLVRSLNLDFAKITEEIAYVASHIFEISDCLRLSILMDTP